MIFLVIATLLLYRGAQINTGVFPYHHGAFASQLVGHWLAPLGAGVNSVLEVVFLLAQLGVVLGFLGFLVYSKHLHIILAPVNIMFSRRPNALGALEPMRSNGKVLDFEEADPDVDVFGLGKIEDFTWKGMLGMYELRCVRRGMPGRHRAHRPHRRDAAAPGADRVRVPGRGGRDAEEPGEQGRPVGHGGGAAFGLDR
jgi:hypothetical protein